MNRNIVRALVLDAFYQVLDNWVFRILTGLTLIPILLTFLVGFREEGIVLLFGWKTWPYEDIVGGMGPAGAAMIDPQGTAIEILLQLFFDNIAGGFGILLAIAATAFFVPRLLEKGAADLYFHKPVSRAALYLSRYFAGLLFIALTSLVLVTGMFLGLALASRHVDPGILLAAPTIVYVFALVFPFTMLVGVVTRSTVASILLSGLFFLFNGCIQNSWIAWEQARHGPGFGLEKSEDSPREGTSSEAAPAAEPEGEAEEENAAEEEGPKDEPAFLSGVRVLLDVLRAVLPKTTDADVLARKWRRSLDRPEFRDDQEYLAVFRLPSSLERREPAPAEVPPALLPILGEPRFGAEHVRAEGGVVRYSLWSRPLERTTSKIGERERTRVETASRAGERLEDALAALPGTADVARKSARLPRDLATSRVAWFSGSGPQRTSLCAHVFKGREDELVFTLLVEAPGELTPEQLDAEVERLAIQMGIDPNAIDDWYPAQLTLAAPWRTNLLFSVGSSLAFAAALLALGLWRLARIAF